MVAPAAPIAELGLIRHRHPSPVNKGETYEIHYQMAPSEARRLMFRKLIFRRPFIVIWSIVILAGAWLLGTGSYDTGAFCLPLIAASFIGASYTVFNSVRKQPWRTEPRKVRFGPDGVTGSGASGSSTFPWSAFTGLSHDARYYFLYLPDGAVFWLPRAAFTQIQSESFLKYANSRNV